MRILIAVVIAIFFNMTAFADEFTITSKNFSNNAHIPVTYTCDGKNISPQLSWKNAPDKAAAFALIFSCPDCTVGTDYLWVIFNIPNSMNELVEGANMDLPEGIVVGTNSFGDTIYRGPCSPDSLTHHYVYTVYALDTKLNLSSEAELEEVLVKIRHHAIKQAKLTCLFVH